MAGTLTISTLSDGTYTTSTTNLVRGPCTAWCRYNGVTQTINASFNISSVTRNSNGDYTFNFTNAMVDANYSALGTAYSISGVGYSMVGYTTAPVAGSVRLYCAQQAGGSSSTPDNAYVSLAVFR
jgi:hypothetical protein